MNQILIVPDQRQDFNALRQRLDETLAKYADMRAEFDSAITTIKELEEAAKEIVRLLEANYDHPQVECIYRQPSERTRWDTKALDGYAVANPDVLDFKTTYTTNASIQLKLKEKRDV